METSISLKKVEEEVNALQDKGNWIGQAEAWIAYHFKIDATSLDDDQFAIMFAQAQYIAKELQQKKK